MKNWLLKKLKLWMAQRLEWSLLWCFAHLAKRRRCKLPTGRVLIARTDGLGDFALWLDAQKQLRNIFPNKRLVVILDSTKPTIQWARKCPDIDEVFCVDVRRYKRFFEVFRMASRSYDVVIQPVYGRTAFTDLLLFACRADLRITLDGGRRFLTIWEKRVTDQAYDRILPALGGTHHELIRCAEVLRGLGLANYRAKLPRLKAERLSLFNEEPYIVVFPGGSWLEKCWRPENFAQICDWLIEQTGYRIVFCGGENDILAAEEICRRMIRTGRAMTFVGRLALSQSIQIISNAIFAFGNDTGAIHIAAVYGVSSAAIVADREWGRFFPYETEVEAEEDCFPIPIHANVFCKGCVLEGGDGCRLQKAESERLMCIESISVEQVKQALRPALTKILKR